MWRLQPDLKLKLEKASSKMLFDGPIVGVHVRRTDKVGSEAAFHPLKEYMKHDTLNIKSSSLKFEPNLVEFCKPKKTFTKLNF
uniref:GT23 domain-containing protein n=1 Tax=Romanomermis culicivorax TaxID=13658 RepID=A0A915I115_ROMCU